MLYAIVNRDEIKQATNSLYKKLDELDPEKYKVRYSSRAGQHDIDISYSKIMDFWWSTRMDEKQFHNPTGLGKPIQDKPTTGKCQFNYAVEGVSRSFGGLLAKDKEGALHLLHNGKFGGGKKGIGKNAFADYYTGEKEIVLFEKEELEYYIVATLNSERFFKDLQRFITIAYSFKKFIENDSIKILSKKNENPLSKGEYDGIKTYNLPERTIVATNDHALITNQLMNELRAKGLHIERDRFRDAYSRNSKGEIESIFEIKSTLSLQAVYTAVGQLTLHSLKYKSKKFFVVEKGVQKQLVDDLNEADIICIYFEWHKNKERVTFFGLERI